MARIKNGILGGLNGTVGDAEGYVRNGIAYVRSKRRKTNKPPTAKVLAARQRMALVNRFINSTTLFVRTGFENVAKGKAFSANNAAKSYQLKNALEGIYPEMVINYSKVLLSRGTLEPAENAAVYPIPDGLMFTWDCSNIAENLYKRSVAMLLVHCPELQKSCYDLSGVKREAREQFIALPHQFIGRQLHCYLSFIAEDRKNIADSVYVMG